MDLSRGDLVTVVLPGAYGKPRPALVIQSDLFAEIPSVTLIPLTSTLRDAALLRPRLEPGVDNGLRCPSQLMIDKIQTLPKPRIDQRIGHLGKKDLVEVERSLMVFLGLA